jgi:hypothetical protein
LTAGGATTWASARRWPTGRSRKLIRGTKDKSRPMRWRPVYIVVKKIVSSFKVNGHKAGPSEKPNKRYK